MNATCVEGSLQRKKTKGFTSNRTCRYTGLHDLVPFGFAQLFKLALLAPSPFLTLGPTCWWLSCEDTVVGWIRRSRQSCIPHSRKPVLFNRTPLKSFLPAYSGVKRMRLRDNFATFSKRLELYSCECSYKLRSPGSGPIAFSLFLSKHDFTTR